eukprot:770721-Amphidinium_carterae.1
MADKPALNKAKQPYFGIRLKLLIQLTGMPACEMMDGSGVIVADCKGAAVVANKLKAGLRKPHGRHSRIETRILSSIGDIEVLWMRSHLTPQQAAAADQIGNAEADLLAGQAVQETLGLPPEPTSSKPGKVSPARGFLAQPDVRVADHMTIERVPVDDLRGSRRYGTQIPAPSNQIPRLDTAEVLMEDQELPGPQHDTMEKTENDGDSIDGLALPSEGPALPTGSYSVKKTDQLSPQGSGALNRSDQVRQDSTATVQKEPPGDTLVCFQCLPDIVRVGIQRCGMGCGASHPKQIAKTLYGSLGESPVSHVPAGRRRERSPHPKLFGAGKRSKT